jgi:RNA polymerase sigma-70 factor (ECF subfamily)
MDALAVSLQAVPMADDAPFDPDDPLAPVVSRVRAGDMHAFEQLYTRTREQVHRTLFRLVGSNSEMEDLVQQVYLQLVSAIRSFRGDARFSTFLYRVCANVALMHLRSRRRRPEDAAADVPEQAADAGSDPERAAQLRQAGALLQRALDQMTPKKRVVFVYHELLGLMPEEIARAVDASPNTVRSRLHHARLEFGELISKLTDTPSPSPFALPRKAGGAHGA